MSGTDVLNSGKWTRVLHEVTGSLRSQLALKQDHFAHGDLGGRDALAPRQVDVCPRVLDASQRQVRVK